MNDKPAVIAERETLAEARAVMDLHHVLELAVLDESGRFVGIVTDRDIRSAVGYGKGLSAKLRVSEVMTADPQTITLGATLDEALSAFCSVRFNALPVMEGPRLAGMLTRHDMLRAFHRILGLDQEGTRVEIALPDACRDLCDAFAALRAFGGHILSAVVSPMRRDGDEPTLYLRVANSNGREVEDALRRAGLIVLVPEHH